MSSADEPVTEPTDVPGASSVAFTRRWDALARECQTDNWDSYGARPITAAALRTASYMDVVPSPHGGLQLELHAGGMDIEVTVEPDGQITEVLVHRTASQETTDMRSAG